MLVNGQEVDRVTGGTSYSRLERMCQSAPMAAPAGKTAQTEPVGQAIPPQNASPADFSPPPQPAMPDPVGRSAEPRRIDPPAELGAQPEAAPAKSPPESPTRLEVASTADPLAASVRLRVQDKDGRSCGSGTIIDSREGEALVLTCGHLFRDSQGKGAISVDLFNSGALQTVPGRLISYSVPQTVTDLTPDVGLVAIHCPGPVVVARLAPPEYRVAEGMAVVSVGCNNGDLPTARASKVTRLNRFNGPPNIEVAGQPVEGRSGGGLFSPEGYVIGICNAADPEAKEGYFGGAASVYAELDREKMAFVYHSPAGKAIGPLMSRPVGAAPLANGAQPADAELAKLAAGTLAPPFRDILSSPLTVTVSPSSPDSAAALPEPNRVPAGFCGPAVPAGQTLPSAARAAGGRPAWQTDGAGRLIVINLDQVSAEFLEQLAAEKRRQEQSPTNQLAQSRPRRKVLEWSAGDGSLAARRGQGSPQLTQTSLEQRNGNPGTQSSGGGVN
jgi:hypothetical protein